jgi:hypothetical protein
MILKLSLPEMLNAANVGTIRHYASDRRGSKPSDRFTEEKPSEKTALTAHIEGAMGEICVAKVLDRHFEGTVNTFGKADIGEYVGVRTVTKENYGLLIYEKDDPEHFYYLVKGMAPNFRVCGWLRGADARQDKYLASYISKSPRIWCVPEKDLHPLSIKPPGV